jgi:hypothetical protein
MKSKEHWQGALIEMLLEAIPYSRLLHPERTQVEVDQLIGVEDRRVLVALELVRGPRILEVEGQLARAVLRLKRSAGEQGGLPVAVVALPRFGTKLRRAAESFMRKFAPGVGWGLLDESGQAVLVVPDLEVEWERAASLPAEGRSAHHRGDRQLFTDLNRWMLKVLLLRNAPEELWGGPRRRPRHPTELAEVAQVSIAKAHNFASAFESRGLLRKSPSGLKLVRVQELLQSWLHDESNARRKAVPARALLPLEHSEEDLGVQQLLPSSAWDSATVGGASAALRHGLLRKPNRQPPLIHLEIPISRAISIWQLEECELRDAQMILSRPMFPRSVFRGRVRGQKGPPLVDMWQVALDSISSGGRGREQADYILERILAFQEAE